MVNELMILVYMFFAKLFFCIITACFKIRCGNEETRIHAIEKYKDELCRAKGVIKDVVAGRDITQSSTN